MRSAKRQPRHCPTRQQVSSRPRRPASPRCPLGLPARSAHGQAWGACLRPNLVPVASISSPAGSPRPAGSGPSDRRARCALAPTLRGPASPFCCTLGSELRACGNGGPFGKARYPPRTAGGWGTPVPGDRCTCPISTFSFPPRQARQRHGHRQPGNGGLFGIARHPRWGAPEAGRVVLLGGVRCCSRLACNFAALPVTAGPPTPLTSSVRAGLGCKSSGSRNLGKLCLLLERGSRAPRRARGALCRDSGPGLVSPRVVVFTAR